MEQLHFNAKDLTGQIFGRLTVQAFAYSKKREGCYWKCSCSCGGEKITSASRLNSGHCTSCGCYAKECSRKWNREHPNRLSHGHARKCRAHTPIYKAWSGMKARCYKPSYHAHDRYAGRGIVVCDRWLHSFENFLEDMGPHPGKEFSLDRIDVNGNYEPSNCRWADKYTQARNRNKWRGELKRLRKIVTQYEKLYGPLENLDAE